MTLKSLIKPLVGAVYVGDRDAVISSIEYDSRRVHKGSLFVAVSGFKTDGNKYIDEAVRNGAAAVISEQKVDINIPLIVVPEIRQAMSDVAAAFYDYPGNKMADVAVTGTNGKSTSVHLTREILKAAGHKCGMMNSLVYDTIQNQYKAERTTPESVDVQKYLYEMHDAGCTYAVIETSSHALVLKRVENITFQAGLYTNFSRDHLDFHKTMEEYLNAKKLLLRKLIGDKKVVVINIDVPEYAAMTQNALCRVITYSLENSQADVYARQIVLDKEKTSFMLETSRGTKPMTMHLLGRFNLINAVGAAALGLALGIDLETIAAGLKTAAPVAGRFQPVNCGQPFLVLVDYAHTSDAIERLCLSAREITRGRLLILFGCGGDRDRGKRPLMGEAASKFSDFAVVTSDNPRTEDPQMIIEDILPGMINKNYLVVPDRCQAIREILKQANHDDTVLIAGKGAEDYQEIGTTKYPYDDTSEVKKALNEMGHKECRSDKIGV